MQRWTAGDTTIEMTNEPTYTFGSADNTRTYSHEYLLSAGPYIVNSRHGLRCLVGDAPVANAVLGAQGGATGVHPHSVLLVTGRCFVAVGPFVACLRTPTLELLWSIEADPATCFGVHAAPEETVISHGELEIARLTKDGRILWASSGADIFTGEVSVAPDAVFATDFEGRAYRFDMATGKPE